MNGNRTLASTQRVIEALAENGPLSPAEIAIKVDVARSSVYRLAEGLVAVGLAEFLPDSRVQLSNRWLHLADAVEPAMSEWSRARAVLDELARTTGQTSFLSIRRDEKAICIAWAPARGIDLLILKPGRTLPLYAGAAGRNILAHSPDLRESYLARAPLPALTASTLTDRGALEADIERTLATGFTFSNEDVTVGIGALGTAVLRDGDFAGSLSIGGLIGDFHAHLPELEDAVRAAAIAIAS